MTDAISDEAPPRADPLPRERGRRHWRAWGSAALFVLVALCFLLPFASTSCTLAGGYGRGAAGSSTVYRGVDLAVDAVPAVSPSDKPARPDATVDAGQLGFQPLATLALLAVLAGLGLALARGGARLLAAWAAGSGVLLVVAELLAVHEITDRVAAAGAELPAGKAAADYVNTGPGFGFGLILLVLLVAVNAAAAAWTATRARAPG